MSEDKKTNLPQVTQAEHVARLQPLVEAITAVTPTLQGRLNAAAVYAFMRLPDSSFGWTDPKESNQMPFEAKALAVIACLRYGLMPGAGQVYYLGNKLYISAEGKRVIAGKSADFKWISRVVRPLNDREKELLEWKPEDKGLAIDAKILVKGETMDAVGLAIVEPKMLSRPGYASKKDIYQTLVTRAELDILKHYLPLEEMSQDDGTAREVEMERAGSNTFKMPERVDYQIEQSKNAGSAAALFAKKNRPEVSIEVKPQEVAPTEIELPVVTENRRDNSAYKALDFYLSKPDTIGVLKDRLQFLRQMHLVDSDGGRISQAVQAAKSGEGFELLETIICERSGLYDESSDIPMEAQ